MKKRKRVVLVESIPSDINVLCDYGCGQQAHYYIGKQKRPCCNNDTTRCKAVSAKSAKSGKQTKKIKYGDENYNNSAQAKQTNLDRYGHTCSLHGKEIEKELKERWMKVYGVDCPAKSKIHQDKIRKSIKDNYGVENSFQIPEVIEQIKQKNKSKQKQTIAKILATKANWSSDKKAAYSQQTKNHVRSTQYPRLFDNIHVMPLFSLDEYLNVQTLYGYCFKWHCLHCGKDFTSPYMPFSPIKGKGNIYGRCPNCFPRSRTDGISIEELQVLNFIKSIYNKEILHSKYILKDDKHRYQVDIYLPELKFGIEYNGLYFHQVENQLPHYHLTKTLIAEKLGIRLFHIRSDEWVYNQAKIKELLQKIINDNLDIATIYNNENEIIVDRSKFNLAFDVNGYTLKEITQPTCQSISYLNCLYNYEDCGMLIYEKC